MEEHRLKPMTTGYDQKLFNDLYEKTHLLRRKLARDIDPRRYGVDYDEILSWFDVKFIHAFNKYYGNIKYEEEYSKAHLVQALQFFKQRILRFGYSQKNQVNNTIDIQELYNLKEVEIEYEDTPQQTFGEIILAFLKDHLSKEAYQVMRIEIDPPIYVLNRLDSFEKSQTKIPSHIIADYLGSGTDYVNRLRREIRAGYSLVKDQYPMLK